MVVSGRPVTAPNSFVTAPNSFVTWRWNDASTCSEANPKRSHGETHRPAVYDARGAGGLVATACGASESDQTRSIIVLTADEAPELIVPAGAFLNVVETTTVPPATSLAPSPSASPSTDHLGRAIGDRQHDGADQGHDPACGGGSA